VPGEDVQPASEGEYFDAIWDTGATMSVISAKVVAKFGLQSVDRIEASTGHGEGWTDVFRINMILPNGHLYTNVRAIRMKIPKADVLIGMDILSKGDFAVTHTEQLTVLSFREPSKGPVDFLESKFKQAMRLLFKVPWEPSE